METACLGPAIASLAFWALTVAEVGIYTWLTLPSSPSVNAFLCGSRICAHAPCKANLIQPGDAAEGWEQVRSAGLVAICHDCCARSINTTPLLCMDRQNVTLGLFILAATLENMTSKCGFAVCLADPSITVWQYFILRHWLEKM